MKSTPKKNSLEEEILIHLQQGWQSPSNQVDQLLGVTQGSGGKRYTPFWEAILISIKTFEKKCLSELHK